MRLTSFVTTASLYALTYATTIGPVTHLQIVNRVIEPDGFKRSAVLAGHTAASASMPGPVIVARKGDDFHINVTNSLTDKTMELTTSIHWHGIFQRRSNWEDGVAGVSQCPIIPGHSFLYKFSATGQAGTFWYHSHVSTQYCDGLRGVLVIYDPKDPHKRLYDVDDESTIITLADWYHLQSPKVGIPAIFNASLINGLGRYPGGPMTPLSVVRVHHNKRYRFRLVSIACDPNFTFSIDNHTMTIIEADGISVKPLKVDSIQIFAGQRYSFVLNAAEPVNNYWIRATANDGPNGLAILRYAGAPIRDPMTKQAPSVKPMVETNLHPLSHPAAPGKPVKGGADVNLNMDIQVNLTAGVFTVNNASFIPPTVPVLLQILSGAKKAQNLLPHGSVYTLPRNKTVEVSLPAGAPGGPHPIHLHGQPFSVVRSAGSKVYNFINPVQRDVVSMGDVNDNVTIRFRTDNPGPWIMHCHIDWHFNKGFAVVFATDVEETAKLDPPSSWDQLCPIFNSSGFASH